MALGALKKRMNSIKASLKMISFMDSASILKINIISWWDFGIKMQSQIGQFLFRMKSPTVDSGKTIFEMG